MAKSLIASALGFLLLTSLTGCSLFTRTVDVSTIQVERPVLVLPEADVLRMRNVEWTIITEKNYAEVFQHLKDNNEFVALYGLTGDGYSNLGLNMSDIRAFIEQQNAIIAAYKSYYNATNETFDKINTELENLNK